MVKKTFSLFSNEKAYNIELDDMVEIVRLAVRQLKPEARFHLTDFDYDRRKSEVYRALLQFRPITSNITDETLDVEICSVDKAKCKVTVFSSATVNRNERSVTWDNVDDTFKAIDAIVATKAKRLTIRKE